MKRISLNLDNMTYDLILREAVPRMPPVPHRTTKLVDRAASRLILETILAAFPSNRAGGGLMPKEVTLRNRFRDELGKEIRP